MKFQRLRHAMMACIVVFVCGNSLASENPGDSLVPDFYNDPTLSTSGIRLEDFESSSVDYFSGMMSRSATDFSLPGNGGMTLSFRRSYNSRQPYSWPEHTAVGVGWNMHFGWVEIADAAKLCDPVWNVSVMDNPVLHMPDGSTDVLAMTDAPMLDPTAVHYRSKGGMGLICNAAYGSGADTPFILVGPDGTRYEFERWSGGGQVVGFFRTAKWFVKKITDRHGNWIWIDYADVGSYEAGTYTGRVVAPTRVTTSDARDVFLEYQGGLLQRILYGAQPVVEYAYQPAGLNGSIEDFRNLVTVTLREQLVWNYRYSAYGDAGAGSMTKVTNPFGGVTVYTWHQQYFQNGDGQQLNAAVTQVVQSESDYNDIPPATAAIWNYTYAPATAIGQRDVTTVVAPEGVYQYTHFSAVGMVSGEVWKVGLKERVVFTPVSGPVKTEEFTWTPYIVSYENNKRTSASGLYAAVDQEYYGSVLSLHVTRIGSAEWRTTSANWAWGMTYLGTPQAQTVTTRGPDGTERVLNRRYQHREPVYVYFLLHQEFLTQQLHPGYTPMNVEFNELGDAVEKFEKGFTTFLTYDAQGNLATMTRGLNRERTEGVARVTGFSDYYLGVARLTTHPDATTTVLEVDPLGRTVRKTDRDGRIMAYAYDQLGRIRHIDYPIGSDTFLTYDGRITRLDRGNYRRTTGVDGFGRNVEESHADTASNRDIRVTRRYDSQGRTVFTSFPNSTQGTHYQYDDYGRVTRATHPGGHRDYAYVDGSHVDVTDENGNTTRLIRDEVDGAGKGELVRIESPEGVITTIARNEYGLPLRIEQGDGVNNVVRTNSYNASLVLLESHDPEKAREYYFYDYAGNVKDIFHELESGGTGRVQHNEYDLNDRVVSTTAPLNTLEWDGNEEFYSVDLTFTYTAEGKPVDQTRSESITRLDGAGAQVYVGGSYSTWHHEYDANGNLRIERLTAPDVDWQFQYSYDANDRLATITYPGNEVVAYQPDAFGWPTQAGAYATGITYHETGQLAGFTYGNGRQASIAVNDRYLVESMVVPGISGLAYDYDAAGNVRAITDARDATQNVTLRYDGMNRMTGADGAWGVGSFDYDETGNIRQKSLGSDNLALNYDTRNRLESITGSRNRQYSYDLFGNIAHRDGQSFGYDGLGSLLFQQVGAGNSGETRYQYDARGRRLVTVKNGERQYSLYANGDRLMYEADPSEGTWQRNIYVGALLVARSEKFIACWDDIDGDGIPHCAEQDAGMNPYNPLDAGGDRDRDGLTNLDEYQRGTGINDADTDNDGISDGLEVSFGMDPKVDDAGGDLDGDGLPNSVELARGFDPSNPADGAADADADGLSNGAEYALGTVWNDADSDNDGMNDGYEAGKGLNPLLDDRNADRDGDGLPNIYEFERGFDPANAADAAADADGDGLTNLQEYQRGTNPLVADTDGDGMGDGDEVANGRNPLLNDNTIDTDGDGMPDVWEQAHGLDPNSSLDAMTDHDGDGDQTGSEYRAGTDPFVAELPLPPDDIVAIPGDGKTWAAWHRHPLAGTYNIDWGVVGESGKQTVTGLSMTFDAVTSNDTLYWFQASATRGQYLVPGRRVTSVSGALVDTTLPGTLEISCERSQLGVAGRDAHFVACEQAGVVTVYRQGPGAQPVPQEFPAGAQQNGKSGWRFASALNGDALYAWLDAATNTLTGARYDAVSGQWQDAIALEDHGFAITTSGSPDYNCRDGDQDYLQCRHGEVYAFDVQADTAEGLYAAYVVNTGYAADGTPNYAFERIRVPLARLTYWTDPFGRPMPEPLGGLQPVRLAEANGRPVAMLAGSPEDALVLEEKAGTYRLTSLVTLGGAGSSYQLGAINPAAAGLSADRKIAGWLYGQSVYGARTCGASCQPLAASIEATSAPTSYAFGGIGDGQLSWYAPGAIRYSTVQKSRGVYSWARAASLATDSLLTNPAWIRFARGEKSASLYWSNSASEVRATHIKADGTWTAPAVQPLAGSLADLGSDWAGNLVVAVSADGSYRFRERRRVPSGIDYSADTTPPVLSHSSVRSGKTTITQVVTLTADEPANRFFKVTGGTITAGGANTTAEQRYTGPVTITFPKGSSATIIYRGINMAERWSNPVSVVLQ